MISFMVAMDKNRLIGADNDLPWRLPADLAYFKRVTMGKPIIMGRKTFESIGRVLPGRENIVMTRDDTFRHPECTIVHSVDELLARFGGTEEEVFVIGGAKIFEQLLSVADRLYITLIDEAFEGDTYFPQIDPSEWRLISEEKGVKDEKNPYDYRFLMYER
ncbi:dihydrofolate reductase [Caldalkalibacillus salinus]|uniref:dihydrofolate reductase n=1 Tax=Caldalkalibacillus salinus TaxID=2803787 RepID=UPI001923521C|nr:dihydrofolate reductase [Caldalkalibacillus salinus]